jgi:hypothetical protein
VEVSKTYYKEAVFVEWRGLLYRVKG